MRKTLFLLTLSSMVFGQELLFQQKPLESDYFAMFDIKSSATHEEKFGVYVADDFELQKDSKIQKIKFTGHIEEGFLDVKNLVAWRLLIYGDNNGKPKGIPMRANGNSFYDHYFCFANKEAITMTLDSEKPKILNVEWDLAKSTNVGNRAGFTYKANTKYWVVLYSVINDNSKNVVSSDKKHFYWAGSTMNTPNLRPAQFVDPNDFLGSLYTDWTDANKVSTVSGVAFELYGDTNLSTKDIDKETKIDVYPNPSSDNINIKTQNTKLKSVSIYSLDGKLVHSGEHSLINVKTLPIGHYLIKVELANGSINTIKFIKK